MKQNLREPLETRGALYGSAYFNWVKSQPVGPHSGVGSHEYRERGRLRGVSRRATVWGGALLSLMAGGGVALATSSNEDNVRSAESVASSMAVEHTRHPNANVTIALGAVVAPNGVSCVRNPLVERVRDVNYAVQIGRAMPESPDSVFAGAVTVLGPEFNAKMVEGVLTWDSPRQRYGLVTPGAVNHDGIPTPAGVGVNSTITDRPC